MSDDSVYEKLVKLNSEAFGLPEDEIRKYDSLAIDAYLGIRPRMKEIDKARALLMLYGD